MHFLVSLVVVRQLMLKNVFLDIFVKFLIVMVATDFVYQIKNELTVTKNVSKRMMERHAIMVSGVIKKEGYMEGKVVLD